MDFSNHAETNMSVERGIISGISKNAIYIRESSYFSLEWTFEKAITTLK